MWNEYVARYHPLGYRQPFEAHQRYFLVGRGGASFGLFAVCGDRLGARGAGSLDWMEPTRPGVELELGSGEHALYSISPGCESEIWLAKVRRWPPNGSALIGSSARGTRQCCWRRSWS